MSIIVRNIIIGMPLLFLLLSSVHGSCLSKIKSLITGRVVVERSNLLTESKFFKVTNKIKKQTDKINRILGGSKHMELIVSERHVEGLESFVRSNNFDIARTYIEKIFSDVEFSLYSYRLNQELLRALDKMGLDSNLKEVIDKSELTDFYKGFYKKNNF